MRIPRKKKKSVYYLHTKEVEQALILARLGGWHSFIRNVLDSLQGLRADASFSGGLFLRVPI